MNKEIEAAEKKFQEHARRKFSPPATSAAAAAGHKRTAAIVGAAKNARAAAAAEHLDAYLDLSEDEEEKKKKKKARPAISSANDYLATLPREGLKVLRDAGIINPANLLVKPKTLSDPEYAALARITSVSNLFRNLLKWKITLPAEEEEEEEEGEEEDEEGEEEEEEGEGK